MASGNATNSPAPNSTTAPVLEYLCLFTKDLKKKQKKWQDGRLKYHTYNKKVMVYDERGYTVGYMHWQHDYDLADGEELELESGGTNVQVCEFVGTQEQDISGLVDKRVQEREQRAIKVAARLQQSSSFGGSRPVVRQTPNDHFQLRQMPLNQVIGTPTGHHGRALVPPESPFEQRQRASNDETPRPAKRARREPSPPAKSGYAQNLFGAKLHLSSQPSSSIWQRPPRPSAPAASNPQRKPTHSGPPAQELQTDTAIQKESKAKAVIDLVDEDGEMQEKAGGIDGEVSEPLNRVNMQSRTVNKAEKTSKKRPSSIHISAIEATPQHRSLNQPVPKKARVKESSPPCSPEIVELKSPPAALSKPSKMSKRPVDLEMNKKRCPTPEPKSLPDPEINPLEPLEDYLEEQPRQKTTLRIKSRQKRGLLMLSSKKVETSSAHPKRSKASGTTPQAIDSQPSRQLDSGVSAVKGRKHFKQKSTEQHTRLCSPALSERSQGAVPGDQANIDPPEYQTKQRGERRMRASDRSTNNASETEIAQETRNDTAKVATKSTIRKSGKRARARNNVFFDDSDSNDTSENYSRSGRDSKHRDAHPDVAHLLFDDDSDASNDWIPPPATYLKSANISKGKKKQNNAKSSKALDRVSEDSEPLTGQLRLEKLGRKSVKSREVIGWVFDQPPVVSFGPRTALPPIASQPSQNTSPDPLPDDGIEDTHPVPKSPSDVADHVPTSSELAQLIETPAATSKEVLDQIIMKAIADPLASTVLDFAAKTTPDQAPEKTSDVIAKNVAPVSASKPVSEATAKTAPDPAPVINARPRIANPATRGRKAAVRSDAQGKVPQHILPTDPNLLPRKDVLQAFVTMMATSTNEAAALLPSQIEPPTPQPERPKIKMKLPGFAPAGASVGDVLGPWTREAYDLLGMGRPSR